MGPAQAPLPCSTGGPIANSALLAVFPQLSPKPAGLAFSNPRGVPLKTPVFSLQTSVVRRCQVRLVASRLSPRRVAVARLSRSTQCKSVQKTPRFAPTPTPHPFGRGLECAFYTTARSPLRADISCRSHCTGRSGARAGSGPCRSPCTCPSGARACSSLVLWRPCTSYCRTHSCT
jgi:hypothetical protein